jgi:hypothetical protein
VPRGNSVRRTTLGAEGRALEADAKTRIVRARHLVLGNIHALPAAPPEER